MALKTLRNNPFPTHIYNLVREMSCLGFFERSLLVGSWVMPIYQELYQVHYTLRTLDVDFAVHIAHPRRRMRADLEKLITGLGFTDYMAADGVQKFTAEGYEVEFIAHRPGARETGVLPVSEWNLSAIPLPFIGIMIDCSETAELDGFQIRFPTPEAYFLHKLIIAQRRKTDTKRFKDLDQCRALMDELDDDRLKSVAAAYRFGRDTRRHIATSCAEIGFPLQRIGLP
jgi:hypothetical protein